LGMTFSSDGFVLCRECERVLLEAFDTEELSLKRFLVSMVRRFAEQRHQGFEELTHEADVYNVTQQAGGHIEGVSSEYHELMLLTFVFELYCAQCEF